jgi:hypothetical protein
VDRRTWFGKVVAGRESCEFMTTPGGPLFHDVWFVEGGGSWDKLVFKVWHGKEGKHSKKPILEVWVKGGREDNKTRRWIATVKRLMFMYKYGLVGRMRGWDLHHMCSAPDCVNPKHLKWGSKADNVHVRSESLRARHANVASMSEGGPKLRDVHGRFVNKHVPMMVHIHKRQDPHPAGWFLRLPMPGSP